ncbi:MAG: GTP-binding protein [Candidatus Heimdallarchaeota archaeon]|nr:GTP-binding protein [Candidatus Heimdallarchaeota archaeon]
MSLIQKLFGKKAKQVNMTVCGLAAAGKTSLINYLIYGESKTTLPTLGMNVSTIKLPKVHLNIHDLGGQSGFRFLWSNVNERSDAVVYIVDSTDFETFDESKKAFHEIINTQINSEIPVLILLNKIDLTNRINLKDFIKEFELSRLDSRVTWHCYETSAKTGEGLVEAFSYFIDLLEDGI